MAIKILLSFPGVGDLKGTSTFDAHKDKIEVLAFNYGLAQGSHNGIAQGLREHQEVSISKAGDEISAILALYCTKATKVASAVIEFLRKDRAGTEVVYATYTLTDSVISNYSFSAGAGGDDTWSESFSLNFGSISAKIMEKDYSDDTRVDVGAVT